MERRVQQELAALDNGITVEDVGIKRLMLPESVSMIVVDRMRSERSRMAAAARVEGEATSQTLRQNAESQRSLITEFAKATASELEAEGRQRAQEILARFAPDEEFAIYLLQLDALKETLNQKTTFVIDTSMPPFDLLRGMPQPQSSPVTPTGSPSADAQDALPND